jgi:hypothetical protein
VADRIEPIRGNGQKCHNSLYMESCNDDAESRA